MFRLRDVPRRLIIGDSVWDIRLVRNGIQHIDGYWCDGVCDEAAEELLISSRQSPRDLLETLIHEVIHAQESEKDETIPHDYVEKIAAWLAEVIFDNVG